MSAANRPSVDSRAAVVLGLPAERSWAPAEGWSTVVVLSIMLVAVGVALDDARWVGLEVGGQSRTWFLPAAVLLGGVWGMAGAKTRLPAFAVHLLGAVLGAAVVIFVVAGVVSAAADLSVRIRDLLASLAIFADDLLVRHRRSSEVSTFLLGAGLVAWASGAFAGFAVFRRQRPLDAVLVVGLILVLNLGLTYQPEFPHLVVFAASALLLLVRANLVKQQAGWLRRRVGDAQNVSELFMRGGLGFVATAMVGAIVLTSVASSAPLAGAWRGLDRDLVRLGDGINKLVGGVDAPARGPNAMFASDQQILDRWISSSEVVFRATTSDGHGYYWQAATYDQFDGQAWHQADRVAAPVEAGHALLGGTGEAPTVAGRHEVTATITASSFGGDLVVAPQALVAVDRATLVWTSGQAGPFALAEFADGLRDGETYRVRAAVRYDREADGGLTRAQLAAAGQAYPDWVRRYVRVEPGSVGPLAESTARAIYESLPADSRDDFHVADAVQRFLVSGGGFRYAIDVRGLCPGGLAVECFLSSKTGFCEHFATTMVMLLRELGIPARWVLGYLPGQRQSDGTWQVSRSASHAWVEVFFPGYGWVVFDPTPGNRENGQRPAQFDVGVPVPPNGASPGTSTAGGRRTFDPDPPGEGGAPGGFKPPAEGGSGPASPLVLLVVAGAGVFVVGLAMRERMRPTPAPDLIYGGVARVAAWFGYGPRPTQTAYEYAAGLGDVVPAARPDLERVARAKVEATYGRRQPGPDGLVDLRAAYRRLRIRLLSLAWRRRGQAGRRQR